MDGEGSLMLAKVPRKTGPSHAYVPRLSIDNTDKIVLERIQDQYGGSIFENRRREPRWRSVYKLIWTGQKVEPVLRIVAPHLCIKGDRAKILLRFIDHFRKTELGRTRRDPPLSYRVVAYRESLYRRMRELNAKGLPPDSSSKLRQT